MSADNHWMPLYVGDYLSDTMHLSGPEHGAYLLLLMNSWRTGPLPDDDRKLGAIARTEGKAWKAMRDTVMGFFDLTDAGFVQARLERIRIEQAAKNDQRRAAGKASAAARAGQREVNARSTTVEAVAGAPSAKAAETNRNDCSHLSDSDDASPPHNSLKTHNPGSTTVEVSLPPRTRETETELEREEPPSPPTVVRTPRGSRIPDDWKPSPEDIAFAGELGLDVVRIAANFRDHWRAKAGRDATKCDWPATWRSWCRNEPSHSRQHRAPPQPASSGRRAAAWAGCTTSQPAPFDFEGHVEEIPA